MVDRRPDLAAAAHLTVAAPRRVPPAARLCMEAAARRAPVAPRRTTVEHRRMQAKGSDRSGVAKPRLGLAEALPSVGESGDPALLTELFPKAQ